MPKFLRIKHKNNPRCSKLRLFWMRVLLSLGFFLCAQAEAAGPKSTNPLPADNSDPSVQSNPRTLRGPLDTSFLQAKKKMPGYSRVGVIDLDIIATIESSNNPMAYNPKSGARGLYQITPICLKDYNSQNTPQIAPTRLFDPFINKQVAKWYLTQRIPLFLRNKGIPITVANILWCYNAGIGNLLKRKIPKETRDYIAKYRRLQ